MQKNLKLVNKLHAEIAEHSYKKALVSIVSFLLISVASIHAGVAAAQAQSPSPQEEQRQNLELANNYRSSGQYDKALPLYQQIFSAYQTKLGADHPDTLHSMVNLANSYSALGQHDRALALDEKVLVARQAKLGADHPDTLRSMFNLAGSYSALGQYDKALTWSEKTLAAFQAKLGADHPETLRSMANLASSYNALGQHNKALVMREKTLAALQAKLGADHPDTLLSMANLAGSYSVLGQHDKALVLSERTLSTRQARLGADHPDTLSSMASLASSYSALGQYDKALVLREKTLAAFQVKLGADHPETLRSMANLAGSYSALGQHDKALALNEKTLAARRAKLGADHPDTLGSMNNLANSYSALGQQDKALALNEKTLAAFQAKLGADHPETLRSMNNLAKSYSDLGQYDNALALREKTLAAFQAKLGADHPDTLRSMVNLAGSYSALGQNDKALVLREKNLAALQVKLGADHPDTLLSMNNLANSYSALGQHDKALALNEKTLAAFQTKLGTDHPETLRSMSSLANSYGALGQQDKALALNEKTLSARQAKLGADHPDTLSSMANLANSYSDLRQHDKALALREKTLVARQAKLGADHPQTFSSMNDLAISYIFLRQYDKALALIPAWQRAVERLRQLPELAQEQRQSLFASYSDAYQQWGRLHALLKKELEGFDLSDLSKARTLMDTLKGQSALRSLPAAMQSKVQALQGDVSTQQKILEQLLNDRNASAERLLAQQKVIDTVKLQYLQLQSSLKSQYPKYARLSDLQPSSASMAPKLLDTQDVFISYLVDQAGQAQVFILTQSGKVSWVDLGALPNLSSTVTASRELISPSTGDLVAQGRLVSLLKGGYAWVPPGENLPPGATLTAAGTNAAAARALLQQYWHDKLIKPILPLAGGYSRWIISPDKDLALLPFDTLPDASPAAAASTGGAQPLVHARNLTVVQSFAVYALLKEREAEYAKITRSKALFAMGNPVYGQGWTPTPNTPSSKRSLGPAWSTTDGDLLQSLRSNDARGQPTSFAGEQAFMRKAKWTNLPGTGVEVNAVSKVFAQKGGVDVMVGAQASEAQLLALNQSGKLRDYRYFLFSAHGYLANNPALSALVLSQVGNPAEHDGYITAEKWPLYDLRSDLTVLSACDTGVGKTQAGEGVMGLPYALFVAGNRNTLLTLWPVEDDATAEFMTTFFERLAKGMSQPQALADTKRAFKDSTKWSDPRYWAGFVLYGV